jgi:hypothetical protein
MVIKKLIAISVVFALVAGAAFAEINFGGGVFGRVNVIEGTSEKGISAVDWSGDGKGKTTLDDGKEIGASGYFGRVRLEASGTNDDETFGGWARLDTSYGQSVTGYGYAWWQPIQQVKFQVGTNGGDGFFDAWGGAGWGWYQGAGDIGVANESWAYSASFYGGFGANGAILTITPLDALAINIGIPYMAGGRGESVYKQTNAQVAYTIDGIGKLAISYAGGYEGDNYVNGNFAGRKWKVGYGPNSTGANGGFDNSAVTVLAALDPSDPGDGLGYVLLPPAAGSDASSSTPPGTDTVGKVEVPDVMAQVGSRNNSKLYAFFDLSMVENLGVQLSVGFTLPSKDVDEKENNYGVPADGKTTRTVNYMPPLAVGLAASYDVGAIGIKARVQGEFAESLKYDYENTAPGLAAGEKSGSYEVKGPLKLRADILPSFAINDSMKVFLSAGLVLQASYSYDALGWSNPDANGEQTASSKAAKVEQTVESKVDWHINPYFTKSAGAGTFYAGFRLWSAGKYKESYNRDSTSTLRPEWAPNYKTIVNWSVPVGVAFSF